MVAGTGSREYALSDGEGVQAVDPALGPISYALGVLGMPGLTAYTGLLNIGKPQPGETLVVAAASGAVGSVVGQIAKVKGCRHRHRRGRTEVPLRPRGPSDSTAASTTSRTWPSHSQAACPNGIDIYFENVGGAVFDAVLPLLNNFARIPVCGLIAHYNATELPAGPDRVPLLMRNLLVKRLTFRGFLVFDYGSQFGDFITDMSVWLRGGRVTYREDITDGLETLPRTGRAAERRELRQEDYPCQPGPDQAVRSASWARDSSNAHPMSREWISREQRRSRTKPIKDSKHE